jgi:nicotinamidase-related amidase
MSSRQDAPDNLDPEEALAADLLEDVLSGRPERVDAILGGQLSPEAKAGLRSTRNLLAAMALAETPVRPSSSLRARILGTLAQRRPARKAILVCDMLNDHLTPGRPLFVPRARQIVPALKARLDDARAHGVPVIYVLDRHAPDDPDLDAWSAHNIEGTEGAEVWPELAPHSGDLQVTKPSYSAFFQSKLESVLDELKVDTLVITGCATEVHLLATATDALQRGYAVEMPPETQAGTSEMAEQVAMGTLAALAPFMPARRERLERLAASNPPSMRPPI